MGKRQRRAVEFSIRGEGRGSTFGFFGFRYYVPGIFKRARMLDKDTPLESRVDCLCVFAVPHRTELPILEAANQIVSRTPERRIVNGVTESSSTFGKQWFGIRIWNFWIPGVANCIPR